MVEKHDTEHEVEGGAPKHSHVEGLSSSSHGGVISQTRIAEAGSELLDDMPFEQMASPQKSGRHGDGPTRPTLSTCWDAYAVSRHSTSSLMFLCSVMTWIH